MKNELVEKKWNLRIKSFLLNFIFLNYVYSESIHFFSGDVEKLGQ